MSLIGNGNIGKELYMIYRICHKFLGAAALFTIVMSANAVPIPVDLSSWTVDGGGNWVFNSTNAPNDSANQTLNSIPTVLFNGTNSQGSALSGTIEVQTTSDDDFIGFVLGYGDNDLFGSNPTTDYILVDWKQGTQSGWNAGMNLSRVTDGPIASSGTDTGGDAWTHTGDVSVLANAATLGSTGWLDNTEYLFEIIFTSTNIQVSVDGIQQFNINGTFEDGSFGFYNFSQPNVRYAGITQEEIPPVCGEPGQPPCPHVAVPVPSSLFLLGIGLLGLGFIGRKTA
jgi:opacity protein-like surface antigen